MKKQNDVLQQIEQNYDEIGFTCDDCIAVRKGEKWGLIDWQEDVLIKFKYKLLVPMNNYLFAILNDKCGIIDVNDNVKIPFEYNNIYSNETNDSFIVEKLQKEFISLD